MGRVRSCRQHDSTSADTASLPTGSWKRRQESHRQPRLLRDRFRVSRGRQTLGFAGSLGLLAREAPARASHPGDSTCVCCEITCRVGDDIWNLDIEAATEIAIKDLVTLGLIEPGTARGLDFTKLKYAYPIYDLTYKENLNVLKKEVKKVKNLHTTGRQGLYRYNNMDHSIAMGRRIAKTLIQGADARADEVAAGQEYFG